MDTRLSTESLPAIYHSGCSGLAFDRNAFDSQIFWERVDFHKILMSSDPAALLSDISTQNLYYSLLERGPGECLEILAHINQEHFIRILDYDAWSQDDFLPQRVLYWVNLLRQMSPEQAFEKFRNLEEEYQLATLSPFIRIYDQEAYEKMTDVDQDRLQRLPGDALYYAIETQDEDIHNGIVGLLDAITACDMNYALSLIAHSAYMPQNESAQTAVQFRKARLEEDGFVSFEESLNCFVELDPVLYKSQLKLKKSVDVNSFLITDKKDIYFIDQVLSYQNNSMQEGFASLANALCTASEIEITDLDSLKFVFTNAKALCSLGLEFLSDGDLDFASRILLEKYPKDMFRVGLGLVRNHQRDLIRIMKDLSLPDRERFQKYFVQQHYALMLDWVDKTLFDKMGFEFCETLKGVFNRFPQRPEEVLGEDGLPRVRFYPIASMRELKIFKDICEGLALCFQTT